MRFFLYFLLLLTSQTLMAAAKIEHWQTKQGSNVYYVHTDALAMVDIQVNFDAGSARDGQQWGLSSLTAALLDTGAGNWNADDIAQRFESVGAVFGSSSSVDMAGVSLRSLSDKALFDKALDTMQVILSQPRFAQADFEREQKRALAGLKQEQESPAKTASLAFYKALYGSHPYGQPSDGDLTTVAALTANDLKQFYQRYYVAANAMVVIVGDLSKAQAEQTAEKLLEKLPVGQKPAPLPDVSPLTAAHEQHIDFPSTQTHVLVGLLGSYRNDPDYFALYLGNHILGGSGLVSKLFDEVREKRGLAYSASSSFLPLLKPGPFTISLQTRNDQTSQAVQVLHDTLNNFINNGITEAESIAAKKNLAGGFAMRFDTNKELATYVGMIGFYHLPLDYLDTFISKIEAVTINSISDAFKRRVNPQLLQTVTVGKSAAK
jgi:zinc protease